MFINEHDLITGKRKFDPDFYIAQSWHRLAFDPDNIKQHDLMLLKHEINEMNLIMNGCSQEEAHDITNNIGYNYQQMCEEYYKELEEKQKNIDDFEK